MLLSKLICDSVQRALPSAYPPFDPCMIILCPCQVWRDLEEARPGSRLDGCLSFTFASRHLLTLTAIYSSRNSPFYMHPLWAEGSSLAWVMAMLV